MNTLETTLHRNGAHTETAPISWRDEAMNDALRGFNNNEKMNALLQAMRCHRPEYVTLRLWPDRQAMMRFLHEHASGLTPLLSAAHLYRYPQSSDVCEYLGWYALTWEGGALELVISPDYGDCLDVVCIGADTEFLKRFAEALSEHAQRPIGRSLRYAAGWEQAADLDAALGKVTWDDIVLDPEIRTRLREAVEGFVHHREAYEAFGFAWRRGVLLVGPPGTGKTMVCKAVAASLPELPFLYVRDLRENMGTEAIKTIFERARKLAPCILVLEDMDGLVSTHNRTVFLNEMDGFQSNHGVLVIASSNHPEKIDLALLRRPSRFDRVFHIGLPELAERQEFCRRILSRPELASRVAPGLDIENLARRVATRTDGFTPAYLKEVIVSAALHRAQAGAMVLDEAFAEAILAQIVEMREHLKRTRSPEALAEMDGEDERLGFRRGDD